MARHRPLLGAALAALAGAAPLAAQTQDWQQRWFWGAKGGTLGYTLPTGGQTFVAQVGGEWLITARRSALYLGYSQSPTTEVDTFRFSGVPSAVPIVFDGMRRIQIAVVVLPGNAALQPYLGGGFVIETLANAGVDPDTTLSSSHQTTVERALEDQSSGGFALLLAGLQLRLGPKLALYGHYQGSPQGRDFLLVGSSHSFEFGLRYAFLGAHEDDVTSRQ